MAGEPFDEAMIPKDIDTLLAIKRGSMDYTEALVAAEDMNTWALNFMEEAKYMPYPINEKVDKFLDEITYYVIRGNV